MEDDDDLGEWIAARKRDPYRARRARAVPSGPVVATSPLGRAYALWDTSPGDRALVVALEAEVGAVAAACGLSANEVLEHYQAARRAGYDYDEAVHHLPSG